MKGIRKIEAHNVDAIVGYYKRIQCTSLDMSSTALPLENVNFPRYLTAMWPLVLNS